MAHRRPCFFQAIIHQRERFNQAIPIRPRLLAKLGYRSAVFIDQPGDGGSDQVRADFAERRQFAGIE